MSFSPRLRLVCRPKYRAKVADNSPSATESRGRQFKSLLLDHPVLLLQHISENRLNSAHLLAIRDHARTRRAPPAAVIRDFWRILSRRNSGGSIGRLGGMGPNSAGSEQRTANSTIFCR
jgi:hypothetical protein